MSWFLLLATIKPARCRRQQSIRIRSTAKLKVQRAVGELVGSAASLVLVKLSSGEEPFASGDTFERSCHRCVVTSFDVFYWIKGRFRKGFICNRYTYGRLGVDHYLSAWKLRRARLECPAFSRSVVMVECFFGQFCRSRRGGEEMAVTVPQARNRSSQGLLSQKMVYADPAEDRAEFWWMI